MADVSVISPLLQTLAGAASAILGLGLKHVGDVRKEYAKRQLDLAQEVLGLFYELNDTIDDTRIPGAASQTDVWARRGNEKLGEAAVLDRDQALKSKVLQYKPLFQRLMENKYKYKSEFRGDSDAPFRIIDDVIRQIEIAATLRPVNAGKHMTDYVNRKHFDTIRKILQE